MSELLSWHGKVQNHCTFKALGSSICEGQNEKVKRWFKNWLRICTVCTAVDRA